MAVNHAVSKRRKKTLKSHQTLEKTGAPDHPHCALLHGDEISSNGSHISDKDIELNQYFLTLEVVYYSATLWIAPYSDYQQFLYDTIDAMHKDGNSYIKIAQWKKDNNHLTPRGSVFKPNHAWNIHMKKRKSIERSTRIFEPEITSIGIDIISNTCS